jgi:hypothetical protein
MLRRATWSRGVLEKLIVAQLVKTFPTFYGILKFITVFTRLRHCALSYWFSTGVPRAFAKSAARL